MLLVTQMTNNTQLYCRSVASCAYEHGGDIVEIGLHNTYAMYHVMFYVSLQHVTLMDVPATLPAVLSLAGL